MGCHSQSTRFWVDMDLGRHHSPQCIALEGNPKHCGRAGFSSEERRAESRAVEASDPPLLSCIPRELGSSMDYFRRRRLPPPSPCPKRTKPSRQSTDLTVPPTPHQPALLMLFLLKKKKIFFPGCATQDLSFPSRDQTRTPCSGRAEA